MKCSKIEYSSKLIFDLIRALVATNEDFMELQSELDAAEVAHYNTIVYGDSVQHGFSLPFEDAYDQAAANQGIAPYNGLCTLEKYVWKFIFSTDETMACSYLCQPPEGWRRAGFTR